MEQIFILSRLRLVEAELCFQDMQKAISFFAFKKEFSHSIYCLKTIYGLLRKNKIIEEWQKKETDWKEPFAFIKKYRENDLHDGNHGFSLQYQFGFININGGVVKFGKGMQVVIKNASGDIKFDPNQSGVATCEGLFLIDNEGTENETWRVANPENFPWMQHVQITLPNAKTINDFLIESIKAYKKMLWATESLIKSHETKI